MDTVLVTGASGFLAQHIVLALLKRDYHVRGTVRTMEKAQAARKVIAEHGGDTDRLEFLECDLTSDAGWNQAVAGCRYVIHAASPIPAGMPRDENELIVPARDGALRVLEAATAENVDRVVMTSSVAAVMYGGKSFDEPLDETSWTDLEVKKDLTAYIKSKTLAERAAWDFIEATSGAPELATIQPALILGPALSDDASASLEYVTQPLNGKLPAIPKIGYQTVDVRDVAELHVLAMESPESAGQRFIATDSWMSFNEVCDLLRTEFPTTAKKIPTRALPNTLLNILAVINPPLKQVVLETGVKRDVTSAKAHRLLGWSPRSARQAVLDAARSAIEYGLVKS